MTHKKMSNEGDHDEASDNHRRGGGEEGEVGKKCTVGLFIFTSSTWNLCRFLKSSAMLF